ncbi:MAG: radical SAM protein [Clostridia bacterium]|nr:radical SAM protein [Clostridia bacterium]
MEKIKRFLECLVPVTACNLRCEYCYVMQEGRRTDEIPKFRYSPEHIGKALNKKRLGGTSYISICGAGETLIPKEMPKIIEEILKQGHYVNVTTNGTLTQRFKEITSIPKDLLKRLHFAFSLHYIELNKTNNLDVFFDNVKMVKNAGCSFLVQLNLYDEYILLIDEIKDKCFNEIGAFPQIAATRKEQLSEQDMKIQLHTNLQNEEYVKQGQKFESPLFDFTMKNFLVKRKEFCYAGDWSLLLNLQTGDIRKCYAEPEHQNIYEDIEKPISFGAIGNNCKCRYCVNSSHFMSLGIVPEIETPTYANLRDREEAKWYNDEMKIFLDSKLNESNKEYSKLKKNYTNLVYKPVKFRNKIRNKLREILKNEK